MTGNYGRTILDRSITGWKVRNLIDDDTEKQTPRQKIADGDVSLLGLIPFLGKIIQAYLGKGRLATPLRSDVYKLGLFLPGGQRENYGKDHRLVSDAGASASARR